MHSSKVSTALKIEDIAAEVDMEDGRCVIRNKDGKPTCYLEKDAAIKIGLIKEVKS